MDASPGATDKGPDTLQSAKNLSTTASPGPGAPPRQRVSLVDRQASFAKPPRTPDGPGGLSGSTMSVRSAASSASSTATASGGKKKEKKMSYLLYNRLVGEADNGKQLPREATEDLLKKYHDSWANRLTVTWTANDKDCVRVKGNCMCFCDHTFKSHEWWDGTTMRCRCDGCKCTGFQYQPHQSSWSVMCGCKHSPGDHGGRVDGACKKCKCAQFKTSYICMCGVGFHDHITLIETQDERRAKGKTVDSDQMAQRVRETKRKLGNGCDCVGCKCMMPCRKGKTYNSSDFMKKSEL